MYWTTSDPSTDFFLPIPIVFKFFRKYLNIFLVFQMYGLSRSNHSDVEQQEVKKSSY